jgi:hypothetical protein
VQTPFPIHPQLRFWLEIGGALAQVAEAGAKRAGRALRRRPRSYTVRRPGGTTPLWNACAAMLEAELKPVGAKTRFARMLGIPRQRLNDFLNGRTRLPDAELTLQMLTWLADKRSGRDRSL